MSDVPITPRRTGQHQPLRVLKQVFAGPRRYMRPWYFAYLLLGIVTAGIVPVLMPLMMMGVSHNLLGVAYVMGMFDVGLLTSPLWGVFAERHKSYRTLFLTGFLLSTIAIAVFPFMQSLALWMLAAFLLGAGSSGAATMASLLIVDFEPSSEWEPRIGLLQSFNGTGQVVGLLLAGVFSHGTFSTGLWVAAAVLAPSLVIARVGLPTASRSGEEPKREMHPHRGLDMRALSAFPHINLLSGVSFHFHALNMSGLRRLPEAIGSPFGRALLSWLMLALGVAGFFTYFPLMLAHSYNMNPHLSSLIYAVAAAVGIVLFVLAGQWSARLGAGRVYRFGLWLRVIAFALLWLPFIVPIGHHFTFALAGFSLIVIAWPIISVSGTNLAAYLAPFSEGEAMGLFNATWALGTVIGAFTSGPLIAVFGYQSIIIVALAGISLSIAIGWRLSQPTTNPANKMSGSAP